MIELELNFEAFEEVRDKCIAAGLIADEPREWDEDAKPFTVGGITFKEYKYVPTSEDIARQEEYRKTPLGELMAKLTEEFTAGNKFLNAISDSPLGMNYLLAGVDTSDMKIGTTLRVRMPADYVVKP